MTSVGHREELGMSEREDAYLRGRAAWANGVKPWQCPPPARGLGRNYRKYLEEAWHEGWKSADSRYGKRKEGE